MENVFFIAFECGLPNKGNLLQKGIRIVYSFKYTLKTNDVILRPTLCYVGWIDIHLFSFFKLVLKSHHASNDVLIYFLSSNGDKAFTSPNCFLFDLNEYSYCRF